MMKPLKQVSDLYLLSILTVDDFDKSYVNRRPTTIKQDSKYVLYR